MKNTLFSRYMTAVVVFFLAAQTGAWGAIFTWNGLAGDGLWETAGNWTLTSGIDDGLDGIPNGGDAARIASAVTVTTPAAGVSVLGLTITAGATLTLGGDLAVTGETWNADEAFYLESTGITVNLGGNDITAGKTHFGLDFESGTTVNGAGNFTTNTVDTRQTANNSLLLYSDARFKITSGGYLDHTTGSMLFSGDSSSSIDLPTGFTAPAPTNVTIENLQILVAGVSFAITATSELATGTTSLVTITGSFTDTQTFFFTAVVTDAGGTNESYTINGTSYDASVTAKTALGTPTAGSPNTLSRNVAIPATVDAGDGILIQFYMSASYLPIGSIQYVQAGKEWTNNGGIGDGFWATATNWAPAGEPTGTDIVTIPSGATPVIQTGTTANAKSVTVQTGATLTFGSGSTLNAEKITNNGTVILEGSATLPSTRTNGLNSTIEYTGTGTPIWGSTYENLTINASGIITAASALVVNKNLTLTAGTLTAQGNLSVSGALSISGAGSANFNAGAGAQATSANSVSFSTTGTVGLGNDSGDSFAATTGNLALGGAASFVLAGAINAGGTISLGENASLAADTVFSKAAALTGSVDMTTGGNDLTLTGGFDCDGNTITLTGGGTLNNPVSIAVGTGTLRFADGTLAGAGSVSISTGTLEITGTAASLTVTDNSIIDMQGAITTLTVSGGVPTVTGTGTGLTIGGNPGGAISTDGTVTITGTAFTDITNSGTLTISNAATLSGNLVVTAGSVSASSTLGVDGKLTLTAGTMTTSSTLGVGGNVEIELGTTLNIGGVLTVTGNWTDNGATFTHNLNGVVFTPAALGTSTITGDTGFADLTCANQGGETLSIAGDIGVTGTLTLSGTGTADRLIITGAGSIDLTAPQTTGQYLLVGPDINIATSTYTAYSSRASGTPPAGWVLYASANGSPVTWTGAGLNANWDNPDNWDALAVPGSIDEVVIQDIGPSTNYPVANVAVNAAEITVDANAEFTGNGQSTNVTGDFSNSGTVRLVGTESIAIGGTTTNVAGSTVEYNGTGSAVWPNDAYQNLTITAAGVVSLGTDTVTVAGTLDNNGVIEINNTGTIDKSDAVNGTFRYSGTSQPVPTLDGYNNLIINCTGTTTAGGDITVGGNLTLTAGTLVMGMNGLTVKGDIVKTNGLITSGGTITLDGSAPQSADLADGTNDSQITNLVVNNALGVTLTNTASFTWSGDCNIAAGTLTLANVTGQAIGGTVTVSGTGGLALSGGSLTAGAITVSNSSGTGIMLSATAATAISAASASFSGGFSSVNINNIAFTLTGTGANVWTDSGFTGSWTAPASGSVAFSGTAPEISSSHALYDIAIADGTTLTALTALNIRNATIGTSGAASLMLTDATQNFRGSVTGTGTLDASAISAANTLTVQGDMGVPAGTALSAFLAPAGAVNVEGNWNVTTLTLAGTPGTISFTGNTSPATIQSNGRNLGVLTIYKTNTNDVVRLSGDLACDQLTLTQGILDAATNGADIVAAGFVDSDGSGTTASFSGAGQTVTITGGNLQGEDFANLAVTGSTTMTGNVTATGSAAFSGSGALTLGGYTLEAASVARANDAGTGTFLTGGGASAVTAGSVSIEGIAGTINLSAITFTLAGTGANVWTDSGFTGTWTAPTSGSLTFSGTAPEISSSNALYDIAIADGTTLMLTTELICHNLAIGTTLPTAQVAANGDNQITVGGNATGTGTFDASALTSATVDINGNIGVAAYSAAAITEVAGNWTVPAAGFTHNDGRVVFNGTGNLNSAGTSFYDIEFSGTTTTLAGFTARNNLAITGSGNLIASGTIAITVGGNWSKAATGTFTAGSSTVSFDPGTNDAYGQEHTITGDTTFNNLSLDASGAGVVRPVSLYLADGSNQTISGALTLRGIKGQLLAVSRPAAGTGSWTITSSGSATVEFASISYGNADGADITASNSINAGNNDDATTTPFWVFGAIAWTGTTNTNANLGNNWATGAVPGQYDRATVPGTGTASNQPTQTATMTLRALTLSETTSSWSNGGQNLTVSSTLANDGTFTFTGAGTLNLPVTTAVSPLGGTFVYSGGTISMESELAGYTNLTVSGGSITGQTATVTGTLSVTGGTLTVPDSATLTLNGAAHTVSGGTLAIAGGGTVNAGTNGFTVGTAGSLTMGTAATSGGTLTCGTLNLGNTSGSGTIISADYLSTVNAATVTITGAAGSTANINDIDFILTGESDWNDSGFAGTWTPPTSGSLTINGSATPTIRSTHGLYSLTVNPGALNTVSINTNPLSLAGNLTLQSGTLSAGALGLSVAGDISDNTNTGELTFTTGTLTLDGSTAQTVDLSQATLYNLTIDNTFVTSPQVTATGAASLSGTLALNGGILDMGANQLTLTGTGSITNDGTGPTAAGGGGLWSTGTIEFSGGGTQTADLRNSTLGSATITSAAKTGGSLSFPRGFTIGIFTTGAAGYNINFNTTSGSGGETTTLNNGGGGVAFSNTGTLNIGNEDADALVCTNGITATGTGTNSFRGTLSTNGAAGHNISLDDLGISGGTLVLDAGANGTIDVTGATSGSGFNLTIANSNGATFGGAVGSSGAALGTVTFTDTSDGQTIAFNGGLYAATLATAAQGYNLSIGGGANGQTSVITTVTGVIAGDGVIRNTGTLALGNHAADSVTFTNGLTDVSAVSSIGLGGTIASTATSPLTLNDAIILNANTTLSSGTGALSAGGTINSATGQNYSLTLNSNGTATLAGEAGGTRPLLSFTTDAGGSMILQAVTTMQTIDIGDDATLNGTLAVNTAGYGVSIGGSTTLNAGSGTITLTGSNAANDITFTGTVAGAQTLDLTAAGGNIVFGNTVGSGTAVSGIVILAANTVDFDNTVQAGSGGLDITAGTTDFAADVTTTGGGNIAFRGASNATTSADLTIRTDSTTDGTFSFGTGTLNATGGTLTLDLGATDFTAPVGSNFGTVIVSSVNNITLNDTNGIILGNVTATGEITVITHTTGTATITVDGAITTTSATGDITFDTPGGVTDTIILRVGSLTVSGGNIRLQDNTIKNTAGAFSFNGGTIHLSGTLAVTGGTLTIPTGLTLNVAGGTTISAGTLDIQGTASYAGGSAIFTVSGTGSATVGTGAFAAGAMTISSTAAQGFRQNGINSAVGNQTVGSLTVGAGATCVWDNPAAGGDLTINGNLANGGTLNFNNKRVTIGGTVTGAITVYDLYIPNPVTMSPGASSTITVRRNMIIDSGGHYVPNPSSTLILGGPASVAGGVYTDSNATADNIGTVQVTGAQSKALASHMTTNNLAVDATLNLISNVLTVNGNLSGAGTVTATGSQNIDVNGNLSTATVNLNTSSATINITGNFTPAAFTAGNSTVTFDGAGSVIDRPAGGYSFYNLTMALSSAASLLQASEEITVTNQFTMTRGDFRSGTFTHLITGNWDSSAADVTWNETSAGSSTIQMTGGTPIITAKNADRFFNLILNSGGTIDATGTTVTVLGAFTAAANGTGGALILTGSDTLSVAGAFDLRPGASGATLSANSSTVVLAGSGDQTARTNNQSFYNLVINGRGSGTVTFTDALNTTNTAAGQGLATGAGAYNIAINDGGSAANTVAFNNTGTLTINTAAAETFSLPLGAVKTSGEKILSGTIALSGTANFNFGTAGQVSIPVNCRIGGSTGTLTLWDAVIANGATLTLGNAGTASANIIALNSASGTTGGTASNITFDNLNANVTVAGNIGTDIGTVSLVKTGGLARFAGDISAATLSTSSGAYNIRMEGGTGTAAATAIANAAVFNNTGSLELGNALEDEFAFAAGFTHTAGATALFGGFNTTNAAISLAAATLAGQTEITTSTAAASGGNITMASLAGPYALGVTAGTGNISITGATGANDATRLGAITISSAGNASFGGAVYCQSLAQTAGSGTTSFAGILDMSGAAGADLNGTNFSFAGAVASAGPLDITHTGTLILPDAADCVLQGRFLQDGAGSVSLGADISTTGDAITFTGPVTLTHNAALNATAGGSTAGANVFFDSGSTIDGPFNLFINAGAGTVRFSENIGASQAVGDGTGASLTAITSAAAADAVYFPGTVRTNNGLSVQGNATALENITVLGSETGTVFTKNIVLDGLAFASAGDITFGSSAANTLVLSTGAVLIDADGSLSVNARTDGAQDLTLAVTGGSTFNGAVGSATAIGDGTGASITINSAGATLFETGASVRTATGISQANAAGTVTFRANVSVLSAQTPSAFLGNLAINPGDSFAFDTAGELAIGNAATDALAVTGAAGNTATFRTRDPANGRITLNSSASSALSVRIENAGIFRTNEDADLTLSGSATFTQTAPAAPVAAITDNRAMIAGGIASAGGAIRFDSETFIFGSAGDMTLEAAGNAAADSIYFAKDLHIAAGNGTVNKTIVFGSPASSGGNIILTQGRLGFGTAASRRALTSALDQVYLNGNPADMFADADSGVALLRAYENASRGGLTAPVNGTVRTAYPDGTAMPALYTGEIDGATLSGKTIFVGKNFYANGADFAAADAANPWTISLPDNNDALAAFAEAYRSEIANSRVAVQGSEATGAAGAFFAWVSAAEDCTDGGGNVSSASDDGTLSVSAGWSFSRPYLLAENSALATGAALSGTYTVFDDVVRVEFRDEAGNARRIENSRGEIAQAVSNGAVTFNRNGTARAAFSGAFKDPACTVGTDDVSIPNEKGELVDLSVFYLRTDPADPAQRWNTDATGMSPGDANAADGTASTDRGRNADATYAAAAPATRNSVPDLEISRATALLYQTLRDEHKNRIGRYTGESATPATANALPGARFTATGDRCRPALVEVLVGQELHVSDPKNNAANYFAWDGHNYFELRWSEPVTIGGLADSGALARNVRSTSDFDASTPYGGALRMSGSNLVLSGYFTALQGAAVEPLAWQDGTRNLVSAPADAADALTANALYRYFDLASTQAKLESGTLAEAAQTHRLRVYLAGYADALPANAAAWKWFWPGHIDDISDPTGAEIRAAANSLIRDRAAYPNAVEAYVDAVSAYGRAGDSGISAATANKAAIAAVRHDASGTERSWDTTFPDVAAFRTRTGWTDSRTVFESSPVDTNSDGFMDRVEFHIFDDLPAYAETEDWQWVSSRGWFAGTGRDDADLAQAVPDQRGGMRSASALSGIAGDGSFQISAAGFSFANAAAGLTNAYSTEIGTTVTDNIFNPTGVVSLMDDGYLAVFLSGLQWRMTEQMYYAYNEGANWLTDHAGLRLKSHGPRMCLNKTPPEFTFTVQPMTLPGASSPTDRRLYILFSKRVNVQGLEQKLRLIDSGGENLIDQTVPAVSPSSGASGADASWDAIVSLKRSLTLQEIQSLVVAPEPVSKIDPDTGTTFLVSDIVDEQLNAMRSDSTHRVTDFGINLALPLYASDGINADGTFGAGQGALRTFDGTGRLLDRDITLSVQINTGTTADVAASSSMQVYFDVNPDSLAYPVLFNDLFSAGLKIWLPAILPSFNNKANFEARSLTPEVTRDNGRIRNFILPSSDAEIKTGAKVEFIFKYGDLFCARLSDPADITSVDPWRFSISALKTQRGGVTILNNVIDSNKREKTLLTVEMPKSGNLVIHVFTMDGNIVRTLERNKKGAGTYTYSWDGTNLAGNPVARGMYFIRVVGPEMDEIRKVMVVKE